MAHNEARKATREGYTSILDRFKGCQLYRDSQPNTCAAYDVIASDHSCIAAIWERSRNENSWKLVLNSEGANGPMDQRDDQKQRKLVTDCSNNMKQQQELSTQEFIFEIQFDKDRNNNSKDMI